MYIYSIYIYIYIYVYITQCNPCFLVQKKTSRGSAPKS